MRFDTSNERLECAKAVIPVASQTFSKNFWYWPVPVSPVYLQSGSGSHVRDVDNNWFLDFVMGLGVVTLGYCYPAVDYAIKEQLLDGISFSLPHPLEVELSELLIEIIPCAEMVRFGKTGSCVTEAAVRLARAYTGKKYIIYWGYHGTHDFYASITDKSLGTLPELAQYMLPFKYNDLGSVLAQFDLHPDDVAAVIMEPMIIEEPVSEFLEAVKTICHQNEALLIFDEMVTGFRWSLGGAQEFFAVTPDLATFGKGIANGMPLAALVGRQEIMQRMEDIMISTTFGGETLSLAAAKVTIETMRDKKTIQHCWNIGGKLVKGLSDIGYKVGGFPCRPAILDEYNLEQKSILIQELIKRSVLLHSGLLINICYSHTEEDIEFALNAFEDVHKGMKQGKFKAKGMIQKPAFKRT